MSLIARYISRQLVRPFLLGVFVITFLLTMDFLFDYLDLFLNKGVALFTVLRLFFLGLGWMLAMSVPCGVLVGVLMTYGHLSQDNEIIAMRASGISAFQAMKPALAAGVFIAVLLTLFNNYVLPNMNHSFANLMLAINKAKPTAEIQEGTFINNFDGYSLFIGNLDDKSGRMQDVLIYDFSRKARNPRTILAKRGHLEFNDTRGELTLHLEDGEMHETGDDKESNIYRVMEFQQHILNIKGVGKAIKETQRRSRGQREMTIGQMKGKINSLDGEKGRYLERSDKALERAEVPSIYQLPGMDKKIPWRLKMMALVGKGADFEKTLPDTFWNSNRRRHSEEAKVTYMQAMAAAKKINQYWVEIHKKFSIPFACIVFVLVGAPLGIRARRGGLAAGFFSVGFFIFYYLCLIGGEQLADRRYLPPWISMWLPNIVLGLLGLWLTMYVCEIRPPWRRERRSC
jgi:lipopolysaccharide export system permease protein